MFIVKSCHLEVTPCERPMSSRSTALWPAATGISICFTAVSEGALGRTGGTRLSAKIDGRAPSDRDQAMSTPSSDMLSALWDIASERFWSPRQVQRPSTEARCSAVTDAR